MSTEDTEKQKPKLESTGVPQTLKTESVVTNEDVANAEKARTNRFESYRKIPTLKPGMTVEEANEEEAKIDAFGIDFGDKVLTTDGIQSKWQDQDAGSHSLSADNTGDATQDLIREHSPVADGVDAARNREHDGGAFQIPKFVSNLFKESFENPDQKDLITQREALKGTSARAVVEGILRSRI